MMETEIFPAKSYSEIKQGLPASTLKAAGGAYGGGSENYIVEEMKIYESHGPDARYNERDISPTLATRMGTGGGNVPLKIEKGDGPICAFVRRLTPLECERLQGLPDNWTEGGSDAKRYKAIGNGMAQPCADFVIEKLAESLRGENECGKGKR